MCYLDTKWVIKDELTKRVCSFTIEKPDNNYWLKFNIHENGHIVMGDRILLVENENGVLRSDKEYYIEKEILHESYTVLSFNVLIKIKKNKISPVSTIFLSCVHPYNNKKRKFAISLDESRTVVDTCQIR